MTSYGEDIEITIGAVDYSIYIDNYSESGGEKQVEHIRTMGNNYETIVVGVSDYELELDFRVAGTQLKTLYENTSPVTIAIALGSDSTVTYNNMVPKDLKYSTEVEGLCEATITYTAPAFTSGTNNKVLS